jgi:alkanesulfonate monooxygenase SsuD/methylene tetrahydromethanopterin reductase-like flavin-dependent oxidoreductase (luciferase family)
MELATTVALVALRGPVPLAKTLVALDLLSEGRVITGVGPGSSERDYDAVGVPDAERWARFDDATAVLRTLLRAEPPPQARGRYPLPDAPLAPAPRRGGGVPLWIGSWGSKAGLRRVARLGDGWLASAYNTTPNGFHAAKESLAARACTCGRSATSPTRSNSPPRPCCRPSRPESGPAGQDAGHSSGGGEVEVSGQAQRARRGVLGMREAAACVLAGSHGAGSIARAHGRHHRRK